MIAKNEYNEIGQLVTKKLHNEITPLQTLNYTYNIRGWLKKINDPASLGSDVFGEELLYNEGLSVLGGTAQYNGNISGMKWRTTGTTSSTTYDSYSQGYGFTYDGLNRLLNANYGYSTTSTLARNTNYDAAVTGYDFNGNITGMKQNGYTGTAYGTIDNLAYTYTGNQLTNVKENATLTSGLDFTESSTSTTATEYTYDANGNMIKDLNKNAQVTYNVLNLPTQVTMLSSSKTINYIYSAAGEKLRETADGTTRYYFGNMVYKGTTLDYIITPEGIANNANGTIVYNYNLKDHLGNVRAVVQPKTDGTALLVQEKDYYPFGLAFKQSIAVSNSENRYLYNGKEMQDDLGLNWYDYGARFYDPQIGRWHSEDPLAEKDYGWTPYRYGYNNPIRYWDVGGKFEMDRNQAQQYKRLAIFLQNSMSSIASNRKIVDGLMKYGQLSEDKIRTDLQWGQGPKIVITDINAKFGHKSYGLFSSQTANILYINEREVKRFEETGKISDGLLLFLVNTILHEYTHYGDNMAKKSFEGETGEEFEKNVFGGIINAEFCDFFLQVLKDEAQKEDAKAQENKEENPKKASAFTDMISNFSNLEEGKYTWDGSNWVKQ
jgi:RHS repeat-associated protein